MRKLTWSLKWTWSFEGFSFVCCSVFLDFAFYGWWGRRRWVLIWTTIISSRSPGTTAGALAPKPSLTWRCEELLEASRKSLCRRYYIPSFWAYFTPSWAYWKSGSHVLDSFGWLDCGNKWSSTVSRAATNNAMPFYFPGNLIGCAAHHLLHISAKGNPKILSKDS